MLAELFPDHYWAAGNAALVCGETLGDREDNFRYTLLVADMHQSWNWNCRAAAEVVFHDGDYERARHYIARAREFSVNLTGARLGEALSCTEFFTAEEYLRKGLLPEIVEELQRVEQTLEPLENDARKWVVKKLVSFYLALGRFHDAQRLSRAYQPYWFPVLLQSWLAYLRYDEAAFRENLEQFHVAFREYYLDPDGRLSRFVAWVHYWQMEGGVMLDVLGPLYEPEEAVALLADKNHPYHDLHSTPLVAAKLKMISGYQALNRGDSHEARPLLQSGTRWFRDHGMGSAFSYFFVGTELSAVALIQSDRPDEAYRVLAAATGQKNMVYSMNMPLYHRLQSRQARLARDLGLTAEADAIEAELAQALALADPDHPILQQLREHQELPLQPE
jgi:hypothetical protein